MTQSQQQAPELLTKEIAREWLEKGNDSMRFLSALAAIADGRALVVRWVKCSERMPTEPGQSYIVRMVWADGMWLLTSSRLRNDMYFGYVVAETTHWLDGLTPPAIAGSGEGE